MAIIAQYKFDKTIYDNLLPEFNEGFTYTYEDSSTMDGFVTRKLYAVENDFVDISKCISRNKGAYGSGIYNGTGIIPSAPMFLDNEILFRGHDWDSLNIDLSDYQGKEINISFTIEHFANQWSELNVGIELYDDTDLDGYSRVTYEDNLSENLIREYSVTWTIPNENCQLYLGGMYLELSNINIMIEDYNLFPNHILTEYDYINSLGFKVNKPSLYDNKLAFSHYWNGFYIECEQFRGKEATISFDVEEIANSYYYSTCEMDIPQTIVIPLNDHYSNTFIIESDHIYIGGNGIKITNLQILVDNRTTEEPISNLPTLMRFGVAGDSNNKSQSLLEVSYLDTSNLTTMENMFCNCHSLKAIRNTNAWDVSNVTNMSMMFTNCNSLQALDLSNWQVGNVTDMEGMFGNCQLLTSIGDLTNWDVSNVTNTGGMFYGCYSLTSVGDLSNWDVSNVTEMISMFVGCESLTSVGDLSNWQVGNVTTMVSMFYGCHSLTSIGNLTNWQVGNVTSLAGMFGECPLLTTIGDLSNWDVSNVIDMTCMFYYCKSLTSVGNLTNWQVGNVTRMYYMFGACQSLTTVGDLSNWQVGNVTDMRGMFESCALLTELDLSNWDVSNATDMSGMFYGCQSLTSLDLSNWKLTPNTIMSDIFTSTNNLKYVGMLYSDKYSIERIKYSLPALSSPRYIYILDNNASEFTSTKYIKIVDYRRISQQIYLPQPLREKDGVKDRLYWDDNKGMYCIEKKISDEGSILSIPVIIDLNDYTELIGLPSYNPITCVFTDGLDVTPSEMTVQIPFR